MRSSLERAGRAGHSWPLDTPEIARERVGGTRLRSEIYVSRLGKGVKNAHAEIKALFGPGLADRKGVARAERVVLARR